MCVCVCDECTYICTHAYTHTQIHTHTHTHTRTHTNTQTHRHQHLLEATEWDLEIANEIDDSVPHFMLHCQPQHARRSPNQFPDLFSSVWV
jgi:hypothetical protein